MPVQYLTFTDVDEAMEFVVLMNTILEYPDDETTTYADVIEYDGLYLVKVRTEVIGDYLTDAQNEEIADKDISEVTFDPEVYFVIPFSQSVTLNLEQGGDIELEQEGTLELEEISIYDLINEDGTILNLEQGGSLDLEQLISYNILNENGSVLELEQGGNLQLETA